MNTINLMGFLTRDPEHKQSKNGLAMTILSVADNLNKEEVIFWRCTVFGDVSSKVISYLKKGSSVIVDGSMGVPRVYQKQDGTQGVGSSLIAYNVRFSPFKAKDSSNEQPQSQPHQQNQGYGQNENTQNSQSGNQYAQDNNSQSNNSQHEGQQGGSYEQSDLPF